jgi:hypothetical protein
MSNLKITQLYLNGSLYYKHPCFETFRQNMHLGIKSGYIHFRGTDEIVVHGIIDSPFDPRYICLVTSGLPLSTGTMVRMEESQIIKTNKIENFNNTEKKDNCKSCVSNCVYNFSYNNSNKNCMYSAGGNLICRKL